MCVFHRNTILPLQQNLFHFSLNFSDVFWVDSATASDPRSVSLFHPLGNIFIHGLRLVPFKPPDRSIISIGHFCKHFSSKAILISGLFQFQTKLKYVLKIRHADISRAAVTKDSKSAKTGVQLFESKVIERFKVFHFKYQIRPDFRVWGLRRWPTSLPLARSYPPPPQHHA